MSYSTVLSPRRMVMAPPTLTSWRASSGSSTGSSDSGTFSSSTGLPNWMALSMVRTKVAWLCLTTLRPRAASLLRIHLFAWRCGSMQSGQRPLLVIMMALSTLKLSFGSLLMTQLRTATASPRQALSLKAAAQGMRFEVSILLHSAMHSSRKAAVKAPRYAIMPALSTTSPTMLS